MKLYVLSDLHNEFSQFQVPPSEGASVDLVVLAGDISAASKVAREEMNDYRLIRAGSNFRRLRPDDVVIRNRESKAWLARELEMPFPGRTVVVTHHCPLALVMEQGRQGHLNAAYSNDLMCQRFIGSVYDVCGCAASDRAFNVNRAVH